MTATTLTDRYVAAVVRGVPQRQRGDLERELRASLADAIDAAVEAGADAKTAEHDAILELGDPIVLTARYAERPLHLIGPALYADWKRLLTVLEIIVVPIVLVVIPIVWLARGESVGDAIGAAAWITFETAVQLAFWITVTFAIVERSPHMMRTKPIPWTPDMLPDTSSKLTSRTEFLVETGFAALFLTAFALSPVVSPFRDAAGAPIPFFDPWIWQTGLFAVLVLVALLLVGANALKLLGRWTMPLAILATLVGAAGGAVLILLGLTGHVLNPAFFEAAGWAPEVIGVVDVSLIVVAALSIVTSAWENIRSVRRV